MLGIFKISSKGKTTRGAMQKSVNVFKSKQRRAMKVQNLDYNR